MARKGGSDVTSSIPVGSSPGNGSTSSSKKASRGFSRASTRERAIPGSAGSRSYVSSAAGSWSATGSRTKTRSAISTKQPTGSPRNLGSFATWGGLSKRRPCTASRSETSPARAAYVRICFDVAKLLALRDRPPGQRCSAIRADGVLGGFRDPVAGHRAVLHADGRRVPASPPQVHQSRHRRDSSQATASRTGNSLDTAIHLFRPTLRNRLRAASHGMFYLGLELV